MGNKIVSPYASLLIMRPQCSDIRHQCVAGRPTRAIVLQIYLADPMMTACCNSFLLKVDGTLSLLRICYPCL